MTKLHFQHREFPADTIAGGRIRSLAGTPFERVQRVVFINELAFRDEGVGLIEVN